jgi:hypothetical protein
VHNDLEAVTTVTIEKECATEDTATQFTILVSGAGGDEPVTLGCGQSSEPIPVEPDTLYTVSEDPPEGYAEPSIRGLCDGDGTFMLAAGESGTCVVRNTRLAMVTITKECATADLTTEFAIDLTGPGALGDQSVMLNCGESSAPLSVEADEE